MKKSIICLMAAAALFTACDPVRDDTSLVPTDYTAAQLGDAISFQVFKDEACTEPAGPAEGNYVKFQTNPSATVTILTKNASGAENILATGTSGVFKLYPKRGASNDQEVFVRAVNSNNEYVETTKTVNVWVKGDLEPELKLLLGEAGVKDWMWDFDGNSTCWGNGGNAGSGEAFKARTVDGHWWGVDTPEGLADQLGHSDTGAPTGEENSYAYMTFDEDGNVTSYTADHKRIRKASYNLVNYDPSRKSSNNWEVAKLITSEPAILFPFSINEGGKTVTEFDVMYLDANHMTLVYTKGNGAGGWGEITHWMFKNATPSNDAYEADGGKWGWANDGNEIWGNAGNSGNGAGYNITNVDGKWWGVKSGEELLGQLAHSGGTEYGDEDDEAFMIFKDGTITSYKRDGSPIRSSKYNIQLNDGGRVEGWSIGTLTTDAPAVLFPWSINEGGVAVTEFDLMYGNGDNMTLVYTKGNGSGSWGEITFWRFARK